MRITKEKKQENHDRIVSIASDLFRERGFDGVGVAELMERAGLTHGGFYNHFRSKEELIAKACRKGFDDIADRYTVKDMATAIKLYISRDHRDRRDKGCPAAALSCEAARQPNETKTEFAAGIENLICMMEGGLMPSHGTDARAKAVSVLAQAVGAIILSRACPDDADLADEIIDTCRANCLHSMGALKGIGPGSG